MATSGMSLCIGAVVTAVCFPRHVLGDEPIFLSLGAPPAGVLWYEAAEVSSDGSTVVGQMMRADGGESFRWTQTTGIVSLGYLEGNPNDLASGVSADGSVIVGSGGASPCEAFRWTQADGMVLFCDLPGGASVRDPRAVTANGLLVVGSASPSDQAMIWTEAAGVTTLGFPPGGTSSYATSVAGDGSVIAGDAYSSALGNQAFRWTPALGMQWLGELPGGISYSHASAISADGSTVVGWSWSASAHEEAFRWTETEGIVGLGAVPAGGFESPAHGVSGNGSVVIGGNGFAFVWDRAHGMRMLHEVLTSEYGIDLTGWELIRALAITPDGRTIVGLGKLLGDRPVTWIARLNCGAADSALDCNSNGTLDVCDLDGGVSLDCQTNGRPDECDIAGGTSGDCNLNAVPDECEIASGTAQDCNTNAVPDLCDLATAASPDCNANTIPDECELVGAPFAQITSAVSRKTHDLIGAQELAININGHVEGANVTSEPRVVGITQLRIGFDTAPGGPSANPVSLEERTCSSNSWQPYSGDSQVVANVAGNTLVVGFAPPLENARTYRLTVQRDVTSILCQSIEVRNLKGDVTSDGRVNAADRSAIVGAWTGPGFTARTDIDLNGFTDAGDRSAVVGVWTGAQNCAP